MKTRCYYHASDLDGHCSGAIVKYIHPDCLMIPMNYDEPLDISSFKEKERVYIVDFSFNKLDMQFLAACHDLIWIDHHKTAIDDLKEMNISGIREIGKAACELTWSYFHVGNLPQAVHYLGRYDVWDHYCDEVLYFQYGMRQYDTDPRGTFHWPGILTDSDLYKRILKEGKRIFIYQSEQDRKVSEQAYTCKFHDVQFLTLNRGYCNSLVLSSKFNSVLHDAYLFYSYNGKQWKVSMYTDNKNVDVSTIAKKYNGGGHKGAAGFYIQHLPSAIMERVK